MEQKPTLYIVATPIGNLGDISARALETLRSVALILSEDTRETAKILKHYGIVTPQMSYRDQNHQRVLPVILDTLSKGESIALTSDSGMPLISDPGFKLVRELLDQNIEISVIPGPSALVSALVVSGLPTDKFCFLGFLPKTAGDRSRLLSTYGQLDSTLILYESPYRLEKLLLTIKEVLGDRKVCVVGELTKKFEKTYRGRVSEVISKMDKPKGEYVVLISKEDF